MIGRIRMKRFAVIGGILGLVAAFATPVQANTDRLDRVAACAGIVLGNGAVDFYLGNEEAFDYAAQVAYTAYLAEVFGASYELNDIQIADQILGGNVDKVIVAFNSDNFGSDIYEELVICYSLLGNQLIDNAALISEKSSHWEEQKQNNINLLKRFLKAN